MQTKLHHLAKRGTRGTWHVILAVPRDLRQRLGGKHHLIQSLKTTDTTIALIHRTRVLAELERRITDARKPDMTRDVMRAAVELQHTYARVMRGDLGGMRVPDPGEGSGWSRKDMALTILDEGTHQGADEISEKYGPATGAAFLGIATGTMTPLTAHADSWLAEPGHKGPLTERTQAQRRAILAKLESWMNGRGIPATVESVTKATAGLYISETLITPAVDPITANARISMLSSYWKWLLRRTGAELNPWAGQSFRKPPKRLNGEKSKRAYTDQEMLALLNGDADLEMADAIRLGALSGIRLEELFRLTVADCENGLFRIRTAKTDAGVRQVPVHPDLKSIVTRRCRGKEADAFLMYEVGVPKAGRERSASFSKRFGRYRQSVGVHDQLEGRRHSRVDYHSFRRWFVTQARNAGIDRATVAVIVGHENGNLTDDTYSDGPNLRMMRRAIESVRLPR